MSDTENEGDTAKNAAVEASSTGEPAAQAVALAPGDSGTSLGIEAPVENPVVNSEEPVRSEAEALVQSSPEASAQAISTDQPASEEATQSTEAGQIAEVAQGAEAAQTAEASSEAPVSQEPVARASDKLGNVIVNVFGRTDVGLVREHNEDNFLVADLSSRNRSIKPEVRQHTIGAKGSLFTVCDGMGGAAAGEVASQIGVDTIYERMQRGEPPQDDEEIAHRLEEAIVEAGLRIFTAAKLDRKRRGMGTTVTAAMVIGSRLMIGQVGDSRAYLLRQGKLIQVTKDQSLVQQLLDAKQLTEEEARHFDKANIILQALGTAEEVHVDITSATLRRNDVLVMCSDGLSGVVQPDVVRTVLLELPEPMEACRRLTDLACEGGGHDNITVIVARFEGDGLEIPQEDEELTYKKFRFAGQQETTQRVPAPPPPPPPAKANREEKKQEEQDISEESPLPEIDAGVEPPNIETLPRSRKVQIALFATATVALLIGIGLIAYTMSFHGEADPVLQKAGVVPTNTDAVPPVAPSQKKQRVESEPHAVPTASPQTGRDEPVLSPTPEELFSKSGEKDEANGNAPRNSEKQGASPQQNLKPKESGDAAAHREKAVKSETADYPPQTNTAYENPYKEKASKSSRSRPEWKKGVAEEKKQGASSEKALTPKPIDDNPF